jgi:type IV pilus assembly protein PilB
MEMSAMKKKRLGEVLQERGQLSVDELNTALQQQRGKVAHLGELLLQRGTVAKDDLVAALREVSPVPYFDCTYVQIASDVLAIIPADMARRCGALPLGLEEHRLVVAKAEPQNLQMIDELQFKAGMDIEPRLAFRGELEAAMARHYGRPDAPANATPIGSEHPAETGESIEFISSSEQQRNVEAMREMQAELLQKSKTTPAVQLVASTIRAAVQRSASDIHIEPQSAETSIRLRVDGILREFQRIPKALQNSVASRVKILSDMDISERRAPQDGRFIVRIADRRVDLRVSTLPTQYGEKVVMRLLEADAPLKNFEMLGFPPQLSEELKRLLELPQGMVLVTGPTGSGKSTTLYGSLNYVRKPSINIVTVEDPVEYVVPGLNQVQVNTKAGLTFASSLRSILRQDPDVIMVGEIRDAETAEISIKAAQTGHLVLSTLHTNDSIGAVTRLVDIGVPGYQIAAALTSIVAQRLVRRLCNCRRKVPATPEFVSQMLLAGAAAAPEMQTIPTGCDECDLTGYKGRIGIYEMLVLTPPLRDAVRDGGRNDDIRSLARRGGMKFMHECALDRVVEGTTTLEEVQRVVPMDFRPASSCGACGRELSESSLFCPNCGARVGSSGKTRASEPDRTEPQGVAHR